MARPLGSSSSMHRGQATMLDDHNNDVNFPSLCLCQRGCEISSIHNHIHPQQSRKGNGYTHGFSAVVGACCRGSLPNGMAVPFWFQHCGGGLQAAGGVCPRGRCVGTQNLRRQKAVGEGWIGGWVDMDETQKGM